MQSILGVEAEILEIFPWKTMTVDVWIVEHLKDGSRFNTKDENFIKLLVCSSIFSID